MMQRDQGAQKILLRGLAYVPLFYAIVQAEQLLVGKPFVWFSQTHFFIAVLAPVLITIIELIRYRRTNERFER